MVYDPSFTLPMHSQCVLFFDVPYDGGVVAKTSASSSLASNIQYMNVRALKKFLVGKLSARKLFIIWSKVSFKL